MSAQIRKFVKARFGVRRLLAIGAVLLSGPGALLSAQDTRTVVEPTFPTTCTALAATQAITKALFPFEFSVNSTALPDAQLFNAA